MNRFILTNTELCIGCRTCEIACVVAHNGDNVDAVDMQNFYPRLKILKESGITGAVMCRHCEDAPCANVCPNDAIVHAEDTIQVIQEKCIGCKSCVLACPYGAMSIINQPVVQVVQDTAIALNYKSEAQKCDLCQSRTQDRGPACVESCPTNALYIMDPSTIEKVTAKKQKAALRSEKNLVN